MTKDEIALVRQGFDRIAPIAEAAGLDIYSRLFALDPSLRAMFGADMRVHARNLMGAVTMVVGALDDLTPVLRRIEGLGRRHAGYGVTPAHMQMAGPVLLATLEGALGEAFTPAARAAWAHAYEILAGTMIAAMTDTAPRAAAA